MVQEELTQEALKHILDYNPDTGLFVWKNPTGGRAKRNAIAGKTNSHGYRSIKINKKDYLAHRLAWFYVHGKWPANIIDHINGDKVDNRISNIRDTSLSVNNLNRKYAKGFSVVRKKFQAKMANGSKTIYLGSFDSADAAQLAYKTAKEKRISELLK
jgi:hypothetical protein